MAELHGEASGADKFFALLEQMSAEPAGYFELLEFFYVCLALGFEGKYRSGEGGRQALTQARTRLYELLSQHRPQAPAELSGRWRGALVPARRVPGALALWAAGSSLRAARRPRSTSATASRWARAPTRSRASSRNSSPCRWPAARRRAGRRRSRRRRTR